MLPHHPTHLSKVFATIFLSLSIFCPVHTKEIALLTIGIGLNIDYITLCPIGFALIRIGDKSLHKDGILCPGFQISQQPSRVGLILGIRRSVRSFNIHYYPAMGATDILAIKFCYILKRTDPRRKKKGLLLQKANKYLHTGAADFKEESNKKESYPQLVCPKTLRAG